MGTCSFTGEYGLHKSSARILITSTTNLDIGVQQASGHADVAWFVISTPDAVVQKGWHDMKEGTTVSTTIDEVVRNRTMAVRTYLGDGDEYNYQYVYNRINLSDLTTITSYVNTQPDVGKDTNASWFVVEFPEGSEGGSGSGIDWRKYTNDTNPDLSSPWSWSFDFPNSTGYYECYSIAKKDATTEDAPVDADAICNYTVSGEEATILDTWNLTMGNMSISPHTLDTWNLTLSNLTIAPYVLDTWNVTLSNTSINNAPAITGEIPANTSTGISLQPTCNVTVNDANGDTMDVTFASNYSGSWVNYQTNNTVGNGSYSWSFTGANSYGTKYWWKVYCDDSTVNVSETYHFTTEVIFPGGDGTGGNPYQITHIEHLYAVRDYLSKNFTLMNDLDFDEDSSYINTSHKTGNITGTGWLPIDSAFSGSLDGENYTIGNLFINRDANFMGLFTKLDTANITNLGLLNVNITGKQFAGALTAYSIDNTFVTNCYSTGNINGTLDVGGLIGISGDGSPALSINESYSTCNVTCGGLGGGGLIGYVLDTNIDRCYATGNVTGSGSTDYGGLIGWISDSYINNSYATGNVTATSFSGGFIGDMHSTELLNCFSTGKVTGGAITGGLVGDNSSGNITN